MAGPALVLGAHGEDLARRRARGRSSRRAGGGHCADVRSENATRRWLHVRGDRRHPVRRCADRELPERHRANQRRPGRGVGRPPRGHQERLDRLQRRVLPADQVGLRPVPGPVRLHRRRQRVDRLPPAEQRRLQPARTAGQGPRGVLPEARTHARPARRARALAGRSGHPRERALGAGRRLVRGGRRRGQQQRPRAMDRAHRPDARADRRSARPHERDDPGVPRRVRGRPRTPRPLCRAAHPGGHVRPDGARPVLRRLLRVHADHRGDRARIRGVLRPGLPVQRRQPRLQLRPAPRGRLAVAVLLRSVAARPEPDARDGGRLDRRGRLPAGHRPRGMG